jgi:glycine cleavage system transcriptional repressor
MVKSYFVVTIIGPDRRGLVAKITEEIVSQKANIEESHMSRLGGEFAVLMLLSLNPDNEKSLFEGLNNLDPNQVKVFIKETDLSRVSVFEGFVPYKISVIGADHEGIVHRVAEYLADLKIQVDEMETHVTKAPVTGTPLFAMEASVQVPPDINLPQLRDRLEILGDSLSVDIQFKLAIE